VIIEPEREERYGTISLIWRELMKETADFFAERVESYDSGRGLSPATGRFERRSGADEGADMSWEEWIDRIRCDAASKRRPADPFNVSGMVCVCSRVQAPRAIRAIVRDRAGHHRSDLSDRCGALSVWAIRG